MRIVEQYLAQLNIEKRRWRRAAAILTVLSIFVATGVAWNLRMTGITIANDATCGMEEHWHSEACGIELVPICGFEEEIPIGDPAEIPTDPPAELPEELPAEEPLEEELPEEELPEEEVFEEELPAEEEPIVEEPIEEEIVEETEDETLPDSIMRAVKNVFSGLVLTANAADGLPVEYDAEELVEAHVHTDECYEIVYLCGLEEHFHELSCYSDETADLENWDIWEESIPELTGHISEDVVLVAQSQLGSMESTLNFVFADDGETRNGITRYGQWYGNPYGPWSNMFTSFCLYYAGFEEVPANSSAAVLLRNWEEAGLYYTADSYEPLVGDIVFFDKNENGMPEATGIVVDFNGGVLTVIEGDVDNAVAEQAYAVDDPAIIGYGIADPGSRLMTFALSPYAAGDPVVAQTVNYNSSQFNGGTFVIYTTDSSGSHYALDGNGNAVEIQIDDNGNITADLDNVDLIYWEFERANNYDNQSAHYIRNVATGRYLHPNRDQNSPLHPDRWETAVYPSGNGGRLRGARQDAYVALSNGRFTISNNRDGGSVMRFGKMPEPITLWLDGTNGNIMAYRGSNDTKYTVVPGTGMQLPTTWKTPDKYSYQLAGWVDIQTGDYYAPGDFIDITENTVLYADWVASTYDIGHYNSAVADTISTNDFITTKVFDYNSLINLLSSKVTATISSSDHTESFAHVESGGTVTYKDQPSLDFSFDDHDSNGAITSLTDTNDANKYTGGNAVYPGIYNAELAEVLFGTNNLFDPETGEGIIGKHYLGEGDHLFQIDDDPTSEYYGYYYYNAKFNAASYNQSDQRFYVYDYLARTSDSSGNSDGQYSDFLPLNSPYANTNGKDVETYTYDGNKNEYSGVTHYEYDSRANGDGARANLWFGMRVDIQFGLPDAPGSGGNKDLYGNDMCFKFRGDDDVWVLIDGELVLDIGGIHQAAEGEINFSDGTVTVGGTTTKLEGVEAGERTLSILYLERGASMSNCAIYFNLAPRFSMELQKEDVLTQEVLQGATFAFYYDEACTEECRLWPSREAYKADPEGNKTNTFTIGKDGTLRVWGLDPSKTYYIKEIGPPTPEGWENLPESMQYALTNGIIRLTLDKNGLNSYSATILEEPGAEPPISHGFTVHGFRIDEESQTAYVNITNARNWVKHTTSVYVEKIWNDGEDHTYDGVTVYLNVTDSDGTVRRIREITLSEENDWEYTWTNLPKYELGADGLTESDQEVEYSVSEAYIPGYTASIIELKNGEYTETTWGDSDELVHGQSYLLRNDSGKYLSAVSADQDTLYWVTNKAEAKTSPLALWTATVSDGNVKVTNGAGQSLTYVNSGYNTRYFRLTTGSSNDQNLKQTASDGKFRLYYRSTSNSYYLSELNDSGYANASRNSGHVYFVAEQKKETTSTVQLSGYGYKITNTPLDSETSLTVVKMWDDPADDPSHYEQAQVTFRLLANDEDTGRTETVSLKTNWTATFRGLPYYDENGNVIRYTVEEHWDNIDWIPVYGPIQTVNNSTPPTYETIVTNHYRWIDAVELPATGGTGYLFNILCGVPLVGAPFVYGFRLRRRHERRFKH